MSACAWCAAKRLQLNANKTESSALLRSCCSYNQATPLPLSTSVSSGQRLSCVSVAYGSTPSCRCEHTSLFHLHRLRAICQQLGRDVTTRLVAALVLSRLDYCNAVLAGLPASTLAPLQRVLHAAAVQLSQQPLSKVS